MFVGAGIFAATYATFRLSASHEVRIPSFRLSLQYGLADLHFSSLKSLSSGDM